METKKVKKVVRFDRFEDSIVTAKMKEIGMIVSTIKPIEEDYILAFHEMIDKTIMNSIRIKLEQIGHTFDTDQLFMQFCANEMYFQCVVEYGVFQKKFIKAYLDPSHPIAIFKIETHQLYHFGIGINITIEQQQ